MSINHDYIIEELESLGWDFEVISKKFYVTEIRPPEGKPFIIKISNSKFANGLGFKIADNKMLTYELCSYYGIKSVPASLLFTDKRQAAEFMKQHKKIVVKPSDAAHGDGVSTDIATVEDLYAAVDSAKLFSDKVILQEQVYGQDLRVLFIGDEYISSVIRHPASITGDGQNTVGELIKLENKQDYRGVDYEKDLNEINYDAAKVYLGSKIEDVPDEGEAVQVLGVANVGQGGSTEELTTNMHPEVLDQARKIKEICQLSLAGIDFMIKDPTKPPGPDNKLSLIEVNARPMLAFHQKPNVGEGKQVARIYLEWLRKQNSIRQK